MAELRDVPCHAHTYGAVVDGSLLSDHFPVRHSVQRPAERPQQHFAIPQWITQHALFTSALNELHQSMPRIRKALLVPYVNFKGWTSMMRKGTALPSTVPPRRHTERGFLCPAPPHVRSGTTSFRKHHCKPHKGQRAGARGGERGCLCQPDRERHGSCQTCHEQAVVDGQKA